MQNYIVFDIETTGLDPTKDRIVEMAWMVVRNGKPKDVHSVVVRDGDDVIVPEEATNIHGITQDMVNDATNIRRALGDFLYDSGELNIVGHNVIGFDRAFLIAALQRWSWPHPEVTFAAKRFVDTAALFKAMKLGMQPRKGESHHGFAVRVLEIRAKGVRYNVKTCCEELGISMDDVELHRAGGDVTLTQKIFESLLERGIRLPSDSDELPW